MKKNGFIVGLAAAAVAAGAQETVSKAEFEKLQSQVEALTAQLQAKSEAPAVVEAKEKSSIFASLPEGFEFGALFEVEANYNRQRKGGDKESDITMATVELSAGWQLLDWLRADLTFLYEENDTDFGVDQAIITIGNTDAFPLYFQAGKMYVPFGRFDSFFIFDPVVLELAEANETAALLGFEKGGFNASISIFNSDVETDDRGDHIENAVLAASYTVEKDNYSFAFGGAVIRNMYTADTMSDFISDWRDQAVGDIDGDGIDDTAFANLDDDTAGVNLWATFSFGPATFIAEYVRAIEAIDLGYDGSAGVSESARIKPESLNLEVGVQLTEKITAAAKYEKSRHVADVFAKNRYGVVGSYTIVDNDICTLTASMEYMREDFGAGARDADVVTGQLALEF